MTRPVMCVERYLQKVQSLLESWMSTIRDSSMKLSKLSCRRNTHCKLLAEAGFMCKICPRAAVLLKLESKDIVCP
jgi:hypothetical protein